MKCLEVIEFIIDIYCYMFMNLLILIKSIRKMVWNDVMVFVDGWNDYVIINYLFLFNYIFWIICIYCDDFNNIVICN